MEDVLPHLFPEQLDGGCTQHLLENLQELAMHPQIGIGWLIVFFVPRPND